MKTIITLIIFGALLISCGTDPLTREESPDKSMIVMAYTKRFGDSSTCVSIEDKNENKKKVLIKFEKLIPVGFKWVSNTELNIYAPETTSMSKIDLEYKNLKINLVKAEAQLLQWEQTHFRLAYRNIS